MSLKNILINKLSTDVHEHKNEASVRDFGNAEVDMETYIVIRIIPDLIIGAKKDNNGASPNGITGSKAL